MKREAERWAGVILSLAVSSAAPLACSSDDRPTSRSTGGAAGAAGLAGTGGQGTGGGAPPSGGRGNGGATGSGGKDTGGNSGTIGMLDGGTDAHRPACPAPKILVYEAPGCDGVSTPVCGLPELDACAIEVCGCDGTTLSGCGDYVKPYRHKGACGDASRPDSGSDAH